ncbi:MAG: peroxidase [Pseudomonadota bacterium]
MKDQPLHLADAELRDIQALVRFGQDYLKEARFHLVRIKDVDAVRAWLKTVNVNTALKGSKPDTVLQIALTYQGLAALGLPGHILEQFSHEFRTGMYERHRARRLGDLGKNAPEAWAWGGGADEVPHLLIMVYARLDELETFEAEVRVNHWEEAFKPLKVSPLRTFDLGSHEPFGFVDGTSQPVVDWERSKAKPVGQALDYSNVSALGEFLLGYRNEYNRYTPRPLIWARQYPEANLPLAEDEPGKLDLGRNGTYLVFRDLAQDVEGFEAYTGAERDLQGAMVGRIKKEIPIEPDVPNILPNDNPSQVIPEGAPLVPLQNLPVQGVGPDMEDIWLNQFTYGNDLDGTACPHGAHVRRANPRTPDLPANTRGPVNRFLRTLGFAGEDPHDDLVSSTRFHRILRRGREYVDGPKAQGLRFMCLNANILRQFEFVQASWLENPKFDGLDHGDPLLASRTSLWADGEREGYGLPGTDTYPVPEDSGLSCRHAGLPQLVTLTGGGYFFLPGLRALRFIAGEGRR